MAQKSLTEDQIQGVCKECLVNVQAYAGKSKLGYKRYLQVCSTCVRKKYNLPKDTKKPYAKYKKELCEECGFIPKHECQLDVHHRDEDHSNNAPENLVTLCANCHRLKHIR